ncbi:MAG TPA: hypothetical protein VK190_04950 [Pseudoneobacillus sp.]|nr:hypothetical protein [Pseudoneobacillus sp.]
MISYSNIAKQNSVHYDLIERWEEYNNDLIYIEDVDQLYLMISKLEENGIKFETDNDIVEVHYISIFY